VFVNPNINTTLMIEGGGVPYKLVLCNYTIIEAIKLFAYPNYKNNTVTYSLAYPMYPYTQQELWGNLTYPVIPTKLYNDHGMYYVYTKDIPKFNPKLAQDLDTFYNEVILAESDRDYLQNYIDKNQIRVDANNSSFITLQYFTAYMDMRVNIMKASELASNVTTELNEEINNT
jgi:hypothetical protein